MPPDQFQIGVNYLRHFTKIDDIYADALYDLLVLSVKSISVVVRLLKTPTCSENDFFCFFGMFANSVDFWVGEIFLELGVGARREEG